MTDPFRKYHNRIYKKIVPVESFIKTIIQWSCTLQDKSQTFKIMP